MHYLKRIVSTTLFVLSCLVSFVSHAQETTSYSNDAVGVRVDAMSSWNLYTTREESPATVKPNFPENKGPNDSPLFIGVFQDQQFFSRLLLEPFFGNLDSYARTLGQVLDAQGLEVLSAKITEDNAAAEFVYRLPQLGFVFVERIAIIQEGTALRAAVWTTDSMLGNYREATNDFFDSISLRDVVNSTADWSAPWDNLEQRLPADNIAGIPIKAVDTADVAALACEDPASTLMWEVTGNNTDAEVWLFGSIHVGKAEFYPLKDKLENEFREADYLVFEVDPSSATNPAVVMELQTKGMLPEGQRLTDLVSEDTINKLRDVLRNVGLPAETFMGMQPWFLSVVLSGLQINALGFSPQWGIENYLLTNKSADTGILELESIQEQLTYLQQMNSETYLNYSLDSFAEGADTVEALIEAWQCAEKPLLEEILFAELEPEEGLSESEAAEMEALKQLMFDTRNVIMADGIEEFLDNGNGSYFVVVGAGHLLGENNVGELLRQRGYQVNPVSAD